MKYQPQRDHVHFSQIKPKTWPTLEHFFGWQTLPDRQAIISVLNVPVDTANFDYWRFNDDGRNEIGYVIKLPINVGGRSRYRTGTISRYLAEPDTFLDYMRSIGEVIELTHENTTIVTEPLPPTEDRIYLNTWPARGDNMVLRVYGISKANARRAKKQEKGNHE